MIICRAPIEREKYICVCGSMFITSDPAKAHDETTSGDHPFLGRAKRLCLLPVDEHSEFAGNPQLWHEPQPGEWCPTCGGDSTLWYHDDGEPTEPPCPTCKGLKAVIVEVQA